VGSKTCLNVGRQSWIMEENTWLIDCVKNKLYGSFKQSLKLMHQPNTSSENIEV
jgi:hypothetical protein